ncbi:MAG: glycine cleavage system aminomethyltransferase GcvT [Deltaproteobacteria bacterium]|nr:MAG: glycine cleavage system aminomethyltransferase GcvT [Deltaproteobacteria bacterium]
MSLRRTPLYDRHVELGARIVEFAGFEMPVQYSGLKEEHERVRSAVGLFDVSHMGEIRVRGPKALEAVEWLCSNHNAPLEVGQAQYNVMCNEAGGVVDDLVVYRMGEEDFILCVNAANRDKDFAWVVKHGSRDGAEITDEGDDWAQIAVQGPKAQATLAKLTDVDLASIATYRFARGTVAGVADCIVARTGYTGEDGFEVFAPAQAAVMVWDALLDAGEEFGVLPIGLGARDTLRLEVRYCLYGHELDDETSPLQAGLGWITKLEHDFLGADAVRARKGKATHRLAGLVIEGKRIAREGMSIVHEGEVVGHVTSGTRSPSLGIGIALAYVRSDLARIGTELTIDVRGREATARVVKGPFYTRQEA